MRIKLFLLITLMLFVQTSFAQNATIGFEISPTFQFQLLRDQQTKIRSSLSGKGFAFGPTLRLEINEYTSFNSSLKLDFIGFNQKAGNYLVTSYRIFSLNVPLLLKRNIALSENWYYSAGGGINYSLLNRSFGGGNWININSSVNRIQPYLAFGLNYTPTANQHFELSALGKYHLIDNYTTYYRAITGINTHLAAFEFSIKYFLVKGQDN